MCIGKQYSWQFDACHESLPNYFRISISYFKSVRLARLTAPNKSPIPSKANAEGSDTVLTQLGSFGLMAQRSALLKPAMASISGSASAADNEI